MVLMARERPHQRIGGFHLVPEWLNEQPKLRRAAYIQPKDVDEISARRERNESLQQVVRAHVPSSSGLSTPANNREALLMDNGYERDESSSRPVSHYRHDQVDRLVMSSMSQRSVRSEPPLVDRACSLPLGRSEVEILRRGTANSVPAMRPADEPLLEEPETPFERTQREISKIMKEMERKQAMIEQLEKQNAIGRMSKQLREQDETIKRIQLQLAESQAEKKAEAERSEAAKRAEAERLSRQARQARHVREEADMLPAQSQWVSAQSAPSPASVDTDPQPAPMWLAVPPSQLPAAQGAQPPLWEVYDEARADDGVGLAEVGSAALQQERMWAQATAAAPQAAGVPVDELFGRGAPQSNRRLHEMLLQRAGRAPSGPAARRGPERAAAEFDKLLRPEEPPAGAHPGGESPGPGPSATGTGSWGHRAAGVQGAAHRTSAHQGGVAGGQPSEFDKLLRPRPEDPRQSNGHDDMATSANGTVPATGPAVNLNATHAVKPERHAQGLANLFARPNVGPAAGVGGGRGGGEAAKGPVGESPFGAAPTSVASSILSTRPGWWQEEARKHRGQLAGRLQKPGGEAVQHWVDQLEANTSSMWKDFEAQLNAVASGAPALPSKELKGRPVSGKRVRWVDEAPQDAEPPAPNVNARGGSSGKRA